MLALALVLGVLAQPAPGGAEGEWPVETATTPEWAGRDHTGLTLINRTTGPAQVVGDKLLFFSKNEPVDGALTWFPDKPWPVRAECVDDGKSLILKVDDRTVLQYRHAVVPQSDPLFSRSGYLHPILTPSGRTITNDSPANHLHHHGLWSAWTSSEFEGRKSNFWESKEKQGRVECVKVEATWSGPVCAGFKARHRFVNLNGPDGEKAALEELWEVRVYALAGRTVFDLVSTQTCATKEPLVIKEYRYGGIGFRGSPEWEGKAGVDFLTSEGKGRVDGHATRAKWVLATGKVDGAEASIAFLCHPSNFRFPQPLRIHPEEPFFNWAVPQGGEFSIEPGRPYVARYRFIVADGRPTADAMHAAWNAYAKPPNTVLHLAK